MITVQCFGAARDITEDDRIDVGIEGPITVGRLRTYLNENYDRLAKIKSYMIAVNQSYADDDLMISSSDEIAIIPPVSGG